MTVPEVKRFLSDIPCCMENWAHGSLWHSIPGGSPDIITDIHLLIGGYLSLHHWVFHFSPHRPMAAGASCPDCMLPLWALGLSGKALRSLQTSFPTFIPYLL